MDLDAKKREGVLELGIFLPESFGAFGFLGLSGSYGSGFI